MLLLISVLNKFVIKWYNHYYEIWMICKIDNIENYFILIFKGLTIDVNYEEFGHRRDIQMVK